MATFTWIGGGNNNAANPADWSGGVVPGGTDTLVFPAGSSGAPVTFNATEGLTGNTFDIAGPFDTLNFSGVTFEAAAVTLGAGGLLNILSGSTVNSSAFLVGVSATLSITDSDVAVSTIDLGDNATLNLTGSGASTMLIDESQNGNDGDQQTHIVQTGAAAAVNLSGTVSSNGFIMGQVAGGTLALHIGQDIVSGTTEPGLFINQGPILDFGEAIIVQGDANSSTRFANNGFIFLDGDPASASLTLEATQAAIAGGIDLLGGADGATLEVDTNMPGAGVVSFGDGNGLLRIDSNTVLPNNGNSTVLGDFFGRVLNFQAGDTIELVGVNPTGLSWSYSTGSSANFGDDVLQLVQGGNTIALLRISGEFVNGTGTFGAANDTNFVFANDGSGDTLITLQSQTAGAGVTVTPTVATFTGGLNSGSSGWTSTSNWSTGAVPGQYQAAAFTLTSAEVAAFSVGNAPNYTLDVSSAQTVGTVSFNDPFGNLNVTAPLTLAPAPGETGGGGFNLTEGEVDIGPGGVLSTPRFYAGSGGQLTIDANSGVLTVAGIPGFATGTGLSGIDVEGNATFNGGTVISGGNFVVGQNAVASVTADGGASVVVDYTSIGGQSTPNSFPGTNSAFLDITGAGTVWKDQGGDTTAPYAGAMVIGGGMPNTGTISNSITSSVGNGGNGYLQVDTGATLEDSAFAIMGVRAGAIGGASINDGAQWTIGTPTSIPGDTSVDTVGSLVVGTSTIQTQHLPWLTVGALGSGNLSVNGGTITLGAGEAASTFKLAVGQGGGTVNPNSGNGLLSLSGGRLDTGGGPAVIGLLGEGTVEVTNGATMVVAAASASTGIPFGVMLGDNDTIIASTTYIGTGSLQIGGTIGTALFTDTGALLDGDNGRGFVQVNSGGSLVATGSLEIGGTGGGQGITRGSQFNVNGGIATVANVLLYPGNALTVNGSGMLQVGSFGSPPPSGQINIAHGATLAGAGLVTVSSVSSAVFNNGVVNASLAGSTLEINAVLATASGTYEVAPAGLLQLDNSVQSGVQFSETANSGATIRDLAPINFQGTISGFYGNDAFDLLAIGSTPNPTVNYFPNPDSTTGGEIQVTQTSGVYTIDVTGYHPDGFRASGDGNGGIIVQANDAAACFAAGTRILTTAGEVAVEALRVGDLVPTLCGRGARGAGLRRITWIGATRIDLDRHADAAKVGPVRIQAHAFGRDMPHRDLTLSPDHAVAVRGGAEGGVPDSLIPVHLLVNGASIARLPARGDVVYFHVELDAHDVLLAEGLPAESYLDTGNRALFAGVDGVRALHADLVADLSARAWDQLACAPLLLGGAIVDEAHRRLAARAMALGHALTDDPGLVISADGVALPAEITQTGSTGAGRLRVAVPAGTRALRLLSRRVVPEELDRASNDRRRLGVAIADARHDGVALVLDGAAFAAGFHEVEMNADPTAGTRAWRWTDGAGLLLLAPRAGASVLELHVVAGWRQDYAGYRAGHRTAAA